MAALDGLRLVAALAVALYHYTAFWTVDAVHTPAYFLPHATRVTIYGFLGVETFFMISGFAICLSAWGRSLGDFFVSRAARLYPAYWAAILITLTVTTLLPIGGYVPVYSHFSLADIGVNLTMLQEPLGVHPVDNVYWTLWTELRFYLLFALVVGRGLTYRRAVLFCVVWMTAAVVAPVIDNPVFTMITARHYAPYFIAGIAMYLMHRFGPTPLLWGIVGFSWLIGLYSLGERVTLNPGWKVPLWPAVLIMTAVYALLLLIALGYTDRITWRWLTVAGALTYPYYLLHQRIGYVIIRHAYEATHLPVGLLVAATMALMLIPAWLVYRLVERPFAPRLRAALTRGIAAARTPEPEQERTTGPGQEATATDRAQDTRTINPTRGRRAAEPDLADWAAARSDGDPPDADPSLVDARTWQGAGIRP
ncbi:acyltransferase family protein [Krasilnikovia sp. M28-CT-15]|uniref:acyltransferase family protein n=1 Tax=Krasilnikovia sp. M28-CT-15 TaxID=3373540 RepID=UPI003875CC38